MIILCYDLGRITSEKRGAYAGFSRGDLFGRLPAHEFHESGAGAEHHAPAVSHHIRYLEQAYGAALFRHNGKRLQLTEAGEILRRTLLTMKHDEQHLQKRMQQAATGTRDYSFGATLSVAEFMLNEALGRFLHLHPDSRIRMQVADTKVLLSKLDSGELDFAVVEGDFPKAEYDFFVFGTEEYVAAAAPDKAARYRGRQLTQLLDEPLLLRKEGSGTRVILEYYLKERGLAAGGLCPHGRDRQHRRDQDPAQERLRRVVSLPCGHAVRRRRRARSA